MSETRWHMNNKTHLIEFPNTDEGLEQIQEFKKKNPEFKGCKIKSVLQFLPDDIPFGKVIELGWRKE